MLYNHYNSPDGFNFGRYGNDYIEDNPELETYNLEEKLEKFHNYVTTARKLYKSQKNMIILMGDDFTFQIARYYFGNIDKLIYHFN